MNKWMYTTIKPNTRLCDMVMPGSHDACMYMLTDDHGKVRTKSDNKIITQNLSILDQLMSGVRMFDIRIYKNKAMQLHAGHFTEQKITGGGKGKSDRFGGFGPSLIDILDQVRTFLDRLPSSKETVVLKFSHVHADNRNQLVSEVMKVLGNKLYRNNKLTTIGDRQIGEMRGKVIAIFEKGFVGTGASKCHVINFENAKSKTRWETATNKGGKLILRGVYSNKRQLKNIIKKQATLLAEWNKIYRQPIYHGELMQLYWTSTWHPGSPLGSAQNIELNTTPLWVPEARQKLCELIKLYKPNVTIMDFASEAKCRLILGQ